MLVNSSLTANAACLVVYYPGTNTIYLSNDSGTGWLTPATLGQKGKLQNSQCIVNTGASSVGGSGNTLTLSLSLTFDPSFTGLKNIYVDATDGTESGWQMKGNWIVATGH